MSYRSPLYKHILKSLKKPSKQRIINSGVNILQSVFFFQNISDYSYVKKNFFLMIIKLAHGPHDFKRSTSPIDSENTKGVAYLEGYFLLFYPVGVIQEYK